MSATILRFPNRHQNVVWLIRDDDTWLVLTRGHGWLHGSSAAASVDAQWLSRNRGAPIREIATRSSS